MNQRPMCEPLERRTLLAAPVILFVRGATRSGGFLEATSDAGRTEQLADINNTSTATGNHGDHDDCSDDAAEDTLLLGLLWRARGSGGWLLFLLAHY